MVWDATGPSASQYGFPTCVFKVKITFPMDMIHLVGQCYPILNRCHVCCAAAWLINMLCTNLNNMFVQSLRAYLVDLNNMFGAPTCRRTKRGHPTTLDSHQWYLLRATCAGALVSAHQTRSSNHTSLSPVVPTEGHLCRRTCVGAPNEVIQPHLTLTSGTY